MCALVGHDGVSARRSVLAAARERERVRERTLNTIVLK